MRIFYISIFIGAACGCTHAPPISQQTLAVADQAITNVAVDGTYKITICDGDCKSDSKSMSGILVIDRSRNSFSHETEAMQYLMRADSQKFVPNYCYYFDPATSNSKDTLFEYDIVSFGELIRDKDGMLTLFFLIDSPDFRYISKIESASPSSFTGTWSSAYAGNGGDFKEYPKSRLYADRISAPDANICFNAVRRYERRDLNDYCDEFPARTCEPGDKN